MNVRVQECQLPDGATMLGDGDLLVSKATKWLVAFWVGGLFAGNTTTVVSEWLVVLCDEMRDLQKGGGWIIRRQNE